MQEARITDQALADLDEIWFYIGRDSISAADRVIDDIYDQIAKLAQMPGMGHIREDLSSDALRVWPVYSYLIIYRADTTPIEIVRVLSGFRDIGPLLT